MAPAQIASAELHQRRRVFLPAEPFLHQHSYLVAGPTHEHGLYLVMAENGTGERAIAGQSRQAAMSDERLQPQDSVMSPIRSAVALPPGRAEGVRAHAQPH